MGMPEMGKLKWIFSDPGVINQPLIACSRRSPFLYQPASVPTGIPGKLDLVSQLRLFR